MTYPHIYSHPCSGTNFLCAQLKASFYPDDPSTERDAPIATGHWSQRYQIPAPPGWAFVRGGAHPRYSGQRGLYLYRDGRDVAVSMWRSKTFQHRAQADLPFATFLRQPLDWHRTPGRKGGQGLTIAEHWRRHVDEWLDHDGLCYVQYEALLSNPAPVLERIGAYLSREVHTYQLVQASVGPDTHGGGFGAWRDVFTEDDLDYFHEIVDPNHEALWRLL